MRKQTLKFYAFVFAVFAFLFWHPATRGLMLRILPLGKEPDDIIFVLLVVSAAFLFVLFGRRKSQ